MIQSLKIYTGLFISPSRISDPCGTVAGMVLPVTAVKVSNFSGHYLRNRSTLDIGVLGYIGVVQH